MFADSAAKRILIIWIANEQAGTMRGRNTFYSVLHSRKRSATVRTVCRYSGLFNQRSWLTNRPSRGDEQKAFFDGS